MASVETATTDFVTNLNAQFQRIAAMHPQLLDAVPPEPIERRNGTFRFSVAEFWPEFCARAWHPRPGRDENLVGPFRFYGGCLAPFTQEGELHWYDPALPARDGDVVLVQWAPEVLEDMYARNAGDAEWMRRYGEPAPIATKVYKTVGSSQYLLTRKSALPLGENRILGVLRKRVQTAESHGIEPNAATETNVTVEPADGSQAYSSATQPVIEAVGLNGLASYTSPVSTATQVNVSWSGQARISNTTSGAAVGEARLRVRVFINSSEVWNQHQVLEGYTGAADWASFSGSRDFSVPASQTIDVYFQTDRSFSSGGSSPAQTMYWREALINLVAQKR